MLLQEYSIFPVRNPNQGIHLSEVRQKSKRNTQKRLIFKLLAFETRFARKTKVLQNRQFSKKGMFFIFLFPSSYIRSQAQDIWAREFP